MARRRRPISPQGSRMYRRFVLVTLAGATAASLSLTSPLGAQSLRGSKSTVERAYERAQDKGLYFYKTSGGVRSAAEKGRFVRLTGNADYRLHNVSLPYATATTRLFVERLAGQYRATCGEQMVVTSAVRAQSNQPRNSSAQSVHPTGIAVDLRKPSGRCLTWLRKTLLSLEQRGVIDGTEERSPPHFHIVVFPAAYEAYVASVAGKSATVSTDTESAPTARVAPQRVALATVARMPSASVQKYRVRKGDSLWSIARRHATSVARIKQLNPRAATKIVPGQTLVVGSQ
jgi:LysM repeat protein